MDLTDSQWLAVQSLIPPPHPGPGRPPLDPRPILNAILWKLRTASPWRSLPSRYPPHQTCYRWHCVWRSSGVLNQVLIALFTHLVYQGRYTPAQAAEQRHIILYRRRASFDFALSLAAQNDWRALTALLFFRLEYRRSLSSFQQVMQKHRVRKWAGLGLPFSFKRWLSFAPIGYETNIHAEKAFLPFN